MLDDVGERLGDDEVRARLDVRRKALRRNIDSNGQVEPRHDRVDGCREAAARQDRGQDPVRQLA
jgi:hypothetical protein